MKIKIILLAIGLLLANPKNTYAYSCIIINSDFTTKYISDTTNIIDKNGEVVAEVYTNDVISLLAEDDTPLDEYSDIYYNEHIAYIPTNKIMEHKVVIPTKISLGIFKVTYYCPCAKCCGVHAGTPTASGVMPKEGETIAVAGIPFGTVLEINGHNYIVEDRGTKYGHIDMFLNSHQEAINRGVDYFEVFQVIQ